MLTTYMIHDMEVDSFTWAYLETSIWDAAVEDSYYPQDFSPATIKQAIADCKKFQEANANYILYREEEAAHDFYLTRNGCGAGFWDGDWPEHEDILTAAAKAFGPVDMCFGWDDEDEE